MAGIQMFDLGPPRVDTFSMISNLGKSFFDAYDAQRRRAAEDRKTKWEDDAAQARSDEVKMWMGGNPSDAPAQPSRAISEVGKLPTFAQGNDLPYASAIKSIESGGKYGIVGPTHPKMGRALGAYQVMEANLPQWSREALGREVTPQEFLSNPGIQDQIFNHRFGQYVAKYGNPQDAASVWFSGRPLAGNNSKDVLGTSVPSYVSKFNAALQRGGGAAAGVPRTQVASASPGMGYAPDTPPAAPAPQPVPFEQAIPGAMQFASLGGVGGAPTMPAPQMAAPAPQAAPVPPPAPPPAPAPVQMAQAAPAVSVASSGDPIRDVFTRLPPGQQALFARYLRNPLTAPAAMQRLQSMVRQNEYSFSNSPDGSLVRTNKATGAVERVPGYEKPQDRWQYQEQPNGDLIGTNAATGKREVLNAGERDAVIRQYQFAQRQGYQGSIFDFKRQLAEAGSTKINNVNNGQPAGETEAEKELGKAAGKRYAGFIEAGDQAQAMISDIGNLREISKRVGQQGAAADVKLALGPYAQALGIDITNLNDLQAADAIIKKIAPQLRAPGSGSTSDIEYKGFLASLGNMSTDPRAREVIYDTFEAVARHNVMRGEIAAAYAAKEITRQEADKRIKELGDPMSAFREWRKQNPEKALGNDKRVELPKGVTAEQAVFEARRAVRQGADKKAVADRLKAWGIDPKRLDD